MLRFLPSPVFRFNEQLLALLNHEGGCNDNPYKRVFVNLITDGLAFNTMARFREVTVRLIESGAARVTYTNNDTSDAVIAHKDYDRKELMLIATEIVGFLEDRFNPASPEPESLITASARYMLDNTDAFILKVFPDDVRYQVSCAGLVSAHGDKVEQYRDYWVSKGLFFPKAQLIYLLTYTKLMDRPKHESKQWVVDNYSKYESLLP